MGLGSVTRGLVCTVMAEPRDIAIFISSREPQAGNENNVDEVSHALSELEGYAVHE